MSETAAVAPTVTAPHPVSLIVTDDLVRSRLTVFFRLLLVIPCAIWLALWGIVAEIVLFIAWIVGLFTGRIPDGLHSFLAAFIRYSTRVNAYLLLLANPWPGFVGSHPYPVDVDDRAGGTPGKARRSSSGCCSRSPRSSSATSSAWSTTSWRSSAGSTRSSSGGCTRE